MRASYLRRFLSVHQDQFFPMLVAVAAGVTSVCIGVRACQSLAPADSLFEIAAVVVILKVAKFCFGPRALVGFARATGGWSRIGYFAALILVLGLMAASVGPSYAFSAHTERKIRTGVESARAQALADSDEYKALSNDIETYDVRIARAVEAAEKLRSVTHLTKAENKDQEVTALQTQKNEALARRNALRGAGLPSVESFDVDMRWVHLALAILLELVGVVACVFVHIGGRQAASIASTTTDDAAPRSDVGGGTVVPIGAGRRKSGTIQRAGLRSVGGNLAQRCAQARRLIETGEIDPSQEALARSFRISQRPATRLLKEMRDEGSIRWAGNRYMLVFGAARVAL